MRNILFTCVLFCLFIACSDYNFVKTGLSNGVFEGNMLEYMQAHPYDWDSTVLMIKRGKLEYLFEGKDSITFFGPTNHSIRRYMLNNNIDMIDDMDEEFCREIILRHVLKGKKMRDEFAEGLQPNDDSVIGKGGERLTLMGGNNIWIYTFKDSYAGVEGAGPVVLRLSSIEMNKKINVASTNIEPNNGVVHALGYDYTLGEL